MELNTSAQKIKCNTILIITSFLDKHFSFPHWIIPFIPYIDVDNSKKRSNRTSSGIKGIITTKRKSPTAKINRKIGILHIFNSILQNKICFPLQPIRGRKKAYTAPKTIIIPNAINPIDRSCKFSAIYIPNRKYGATRTIRFLLPASGGKAPHKILVSWDTSKNSDSF